MTIFLNYQEAEEANSPKTLMWGVKLHTFLPKGLKRDIKVILEMIIYQALVATSATLVGLFLLAESSGLKKVIDEIVGVNLCLDACISL